MKQGDVIMKQGDVIMKQGKGYNIKDLPTTINLFSILYTINYVDVPTDVDSEKRKALFGQIDYWNRTIRIYYKDRPLEDVFMTLLHEILHLIEGELEIGLFEGDDEEKKINQLTLSLFDILKRNNWLKFP